VIFISLQKRVFPPAAWRPGLLLAVPCHKLQGTWPCAATQRFYPSQVKRALELQEVLKLTRRRRSRRSSWHAPHLNPFVCPCTASKRPQRPRRTQPRIGVRGRASGWAGHPPAIPHALDPHKGPWGAVCRSLGRLARGKTGGWRSGSSFRKRCLMIDKAIDKAIDDANSSEFLIWQRYTVVTETTEPQNLMQYWASKSDAESFIIQSADKNMKISYFTRAHKW